MYIIQKHLFQISKAPFTSCKAQQKKRCFFTTELFILQWPKSKEKYSSQKFKQKTKSTLNKLFGVVKGFF